jgi:hypothetical protein
LSPRPAPSGRLRGAARSPRRLSRRLRLSLAACRTLGPRSSSWGEPGGREAGPLCEGGPTSGQREGARARRAIQRAFVEHDRISFTHSEAERDILFVVGTRSGIFRATILKRLESPVRLLGKRLPLRRVDRSTTNSAIPSAVTGSIAKPTFRRCSAKRS